MVHMPAVNTCGLPGVYVSFSFESKNPLPLLLLFIVLLYVLFFI